MQRIIDTLGGFWELGRIAIRARGRGTSPYWRWRHETAFGTNPEHRPSGRQRFRAMLDYGIWVFRMKRGR